MAWCKSLKTLDAGHWALETDAQTRIPTLKAQDALVDAEDGRLAALGERDALSAELLEVRCERDALFAELSEARGERDALSAELSEARGELERSREVKESAAFNPPLLRCVT